MVSNAQPNPISLDDDDQSRRIALFSNRVALKKAYASALRQHEHDARALQSSDREIQRLQTKLDYLENLLTEPDSAFSTLLFFHLRGLWRRCHRHLASRAELLTTRASGRRRVVAIESWQARHKLKMTTLDDTLEHERGDMTGLKKQLRALGHELERSSGWWRWFKRRRLQRERDGLALLLQSALITHNETMQQWRRMKRQRAPKDVTLTLNDARHTNLQLLATAQYMHRFFDERGLTELTRMAFHRDVGVIDFGDDRKCRELFTSVDRAFVQFLETVADAEHEPMLAPQVHRLAELARYDSDTAVVPEPFELPVDGMIRGDGGLTVSDAFADPRTVIDEDIWSISQAFVRP
ncbi:MAG: hypothetical protein AAF004_02935 [Pseudomonadota bacterium]